MTTAVVTERDVGRLIQRTLQIGVWLALACFAVGLALRLLAHPAAAGNWFLAGVVVLILTPVARVAMLAFGYWRAKEYAFTLAALVVLSLLLIAVLL